MNLQRNSSFAFVASTLVCAAAITILFGSSSFGSDKVDQAANKNGQIDQPARDATTTDLDLILAQWFEGCSKIQSLSGTCRVSEFNTVFETEKPSRCEFVFESRSRWRIDRRAVKVDRRAVSEKRSRDGAPYTLELSTSTSMMSIDEEFYWIDLDRKAYSKETVRLADRDKQDFAIPVAFATFLDVNAIQRAFTLKVSKETPGQIVLLARPKEKKKIEPIVTDWWPFVGKLSFFNIVIGTDVRGMLVTLDKRTYLPSKIQFRTRSGDDVIYAFESVTPNSAEYKGIEVTKDCLKGFRPFGYDEDAETIDEGCADALHPVSQ